MGPTSARAGLALLAFLATFVAGSATATATVSVGLNSQNELVITAGTANNLITMGQTVEDSELIIVSTGDPIALVGSHCSTPSSRTSGTTGTTIQSTRCPVGPVSVVRVSLGGGDDSWTDGRINNVQTNVAGLEGNDVIAASENVSGGIEGIDRIDGGDGNDTIGGGGGFGDTLIGGLGDDVIDDQDDPTDTYSDFDQIDGGGGRDLITFGTSIRGRTTVSGGSEDDTLVEVSSPGGDTIDGGAGMDTLRLDRENGVSIRDGAPTLLGTTTTIFNRGIAEENPEGIEHFAGTYGDDLINGAVSPRTAPRAYDGRDGADALVGSATSDKLTGGDGADQLFGRDGEDLLDAKAGEPLAFPDAEIDCGEGSTDKTSIDLLDPEPTDCETVNRSAIGEGPHLRVGAVRRVGRRTYSARVRCPRGLKHRCKGALKLALRRQGLDRARTRAYSIGAGRRGRVRVRLSAADVRAVDRLRARGRRVDGFVESTEKGDVAGNKTTTAKRRLRR
jgi:Ca2+-binding RTX toxin-like protein